MSKQYKLTECVMLYIFDQNLKNKAVLIMIKNYMIFVLCSAKEKEPPRTEDNQLHIEHCLITPLVLAFVAESDKISVRWFLS